MADKKPIGVLLVHGIGTAAQGETLIGYSEPLYKWIEKWLKRNTPPASTSTSTSDEDNNHVSVLHADLHPSGDAPAHTEWLLRIKQGNGRKRRIEESHWLLAEAWWAETFSPSSWTQTLKWAIQIAPSLVLRHFIRVVRSVIRDGRKNFLFYLLALPVVPFYIILAIFATFLIQVLALLILIMASITAIIPIAPLKYFVTSMQNIISNFIGDIYLRITSPIQRAAMVSKVKHDLKWLEERCDKIAIVAHSQGSAICYELLKEYKPKKVKRLVTLGQAIKLLKTIESRRWTGLYWAVIIIVDVLLPYLAIQTLVSASKWWQDIADLYVVGRGFFNPDSLWTLVVVVIACAGLGIILWVLAKSLYDYALWNPLTDEKWFELDKEFRWIDLYASNDPAPNGVLAEELPEFIESRPIYNHANLITDHTTYWGNIDEFVTAVFYAVNELTGIKLADLTDDLLKQSRARRKWRVVCLAWVRNLVMLCSVILLWIAAINTASTIQGKTTSHLASIGNGVAEWFMRDFGKLPFVDAISNFMAGLTRSELGKEALGGIVLLTIPLAWYFLASFVWKLWEGADVDRFFKRETRNQNEDDFGGVYFTMLVILVSILILAAIVYYIASVNPSFFNPLAQHGNQIIGTSFYMFVISLILLRWFFSKRFTRGESFTVAILFAILAASLVTWLEANEIKYWRSVYFWVGNLTLFGLVLLYYRLIGSKLYILSRLRRWFTQLSRSVSAENPPSDSNFQRLGRISVIGANLVQAITSAIMGGIALIIALRPIVHWTQWMHDLVPCLMSGWAWLGIFIGSKVLSKADNPKWIKAISILGIVMMILACLLLMLMVYLPL